MGLVRDAFLDRARKISSTNLLFMFELLYTKKTGRGVSTAEAKAWLRELDRLGEGLDSRRLLTACLVSRALFVSLGADLFPI